MTTSVATRASFGSVLVDTMAVAGYREGSWSPHQLQGTAPIALHPAAHVLHYGSSCFEGLKAYRWSDDSVHVFRLHQHVERMRQSARALCLPEPDAAHLVRMILDLVNRCREQVPKAPGALYLRPILFGTLRNIGAASLPSSEADLIVLASPVWDYFAGGVRLLRILVDESHTRTASHLGSVKTGGNYAAALGPTLHARRHFRADQVLFCPGGQVQETGASNFLLLREGRVLTRSLDSTFLHGVTRDSLLTLARELAYVTEERIFDVDEMLDWVRHGEAALSGTAAVLAGVGVLIRDGNEYRIGSGEVGAHTQKLREALIAIQRGNAPDRHGWLTRVGTP